MKNIEELVEAANTILKFSSLYHGGAVAYHGAIGIYALVTGDAIEVHKRGSEAYNHIQAIFQNQQNK